MTPRPHAEIIKQWADGHDIQYRRPCSNEWVDSPDPAFVSDYSYRVKPVRVFPETLLSDGEITLKWRELRNDNMLNYEEERRELINYGIKHAIDYGHVAPREEFDQVANECKRATKTLVAAGYTDEGGEMWKPPLGRACEDRRARAMTVAKAVHEAAKRASMYPGAAMQVAGLDLKQIIESVG